MTGNGDNGLMGLDNTELAIMNLPALEANSLDTLAFTSHCERPLTFPALEDTSLPFQLAPPSPTGKEVMAETVTWPEPRAEVMHGLEKVIQSFNTDGNLSFKIAESCRPRNKPYMMADKILFTKPMNAVKIQVVNGEEGQMVSLSMRFKAEAHHHQPVLACSEHRKQGEHSEATFYVYQECNLVTYSVEDRHHTALVMLTEDLCLYPVFKCWNYCNRRFGKWQEMVLTLLDEARNTLHQTIIDVRVCANIRRDMLQYKKEKEQLSCRREGAKRQRSRPQVGNRPQRSECANEGPSSDKPRYFMVKMEDSSLVATLETLARVRGDLVEIDAACNPDSYFPAALQGVGNLPGPCDQV